MSPEWCAPRSTTPTVGRHQARARSRLTTALLIIHGLVAVALLGAITHQTLAAWVPARSQPDSFCRRVRAVPSAAFTNAIVILYAVSALLGALLYLPFRVAVRVELERAPAIGKRLGSSNSRSISSPRSCHQAHMQQRISAHVLARRSDPAETPHCRARLPEVLGPNISTLSNGLDAHGRKRFRVNFVCCSG